MGRNWSTKEKRSRFESSVALPDLVFAAVRLETLLWMYSRPCFASSHTPVWRLWLRFR